MLSHAGVCDDLCKWQWLQLYFFLLSYHISLWLFIGRHMNAPLQAAPCQA